MSARSGRRGKDDRRRRRQQARASRHQARPRGEASGAGVEVVLMDAAGRERVEFWPADHPLLEQMRHDCAICRADEAAGR